MLAETMIVFDVEMVLFHLIIQKSSISNVTQDLQINGTEVLICVIFTYINSFMRNGTHFFFFFFFFFKFYYKFFAIP